MWPAIALIAASQLLNYQNNKDAQKRRESFRRSMEAFQRSKAEESRAASEQLLQKQTPEQRGDELAQATAQRGESMRDTVGAAQAFDAPATAGERGADFAATSEREAQARAEKLRRAIEQLSTMQAPGEQQNAFGLRFGRAAARVDAANRASARVGAGYERDIAGVQPDPLIGMVSQVGSAVGTGMLAAPSGGSQPNLVSPSNAEWGSLDAGEGAYSMSRARSPYASKLLGALGNLRTAGTSGIWGR